MGSSSDVHTAETSDDGNMELRVLLACDAAWVRPKSTYIWTGAIEGYPCQAARVNRQRQVVALAPFPTGYTSRTSPLRPI